MADVYGLDPDLLATVPQPVLALLLLFPLNEKVQNYALKLKLNLYVQQYYCLSLRTIFDKKKKRKKISK